MNKIKLLGISPYSGMNEILKELVSNREDIEADCRIADLEDAISLIHELNPNNYDVIISRGGTAQQLKKHTTLPVIDAGLSTLDVLRAIKLAQNFSADFAVVGFENIANHAHTLNELLQYDIPIYMISSKEESELKLDELQRQGTHIIVCDVITSRIAQKKGMNSVLITSGYETIKTALDQAVYLTKRYMNDKGTFTHLTLSSLYNPVKCVIFDQDGELLMSSLEDTPSSQEIIRTLKKSFDFLWHVDSRQVERKLKDCVLSITKKHVQMKNCSYLYLYLRIDEAHEIRKINSIQRMTSNSEDDVDFGYYTSSHSIGNTQDLIERYSKTDSPIIISGESGTGKDKAAYFIYKKSSFQHQLFYQIDCETATDKEWNYLLTHYDSPLAHSGRTLYFRHINSVEKHTFNRLLSHITDTHLSKRNRLLFSITSSQGNQNHLAYLEQLAKQLPCLSLYLPALRERTDDIPSLATLYINRFNATLGKQIIGFEPRARQALQSFPWNSNLDQFKRIIQELMLITTTSYISYENTMRLLRQETSVWIPASSPSFQFDIYQPLDSIVYDIARLVLEQENNNHTNAAQRLGIGRSTLWRILKSHEQS